MGTREKDFKKSLTQSLFFFSFTTPPPCKKISPPLFGVVYSNIRGGAGVRARGRSVKNAVLSWDHSSISLARITLSFFRPVKFRTELFPNPVSHPIGIPPAQDMRLTVAICVVLS